MESPPQTLRAELEAARRSGVDFTAAWPQALAAAARGADEGPEWTAALDATRQGWRAAYRREPSRRRERALALVGTDPERTTAIETRDPNCGFCGEALAPGKRPSVRYCSRSCQRAAHGRRVAA